MTPAIWAPGPGRQPRVGPIRATADLPNMFRRPFGPGWALVGDAGLVMDPITGQGIGQAFRDAEMVSAAIHAGISGSTPLEQGLAAYQQRRDAESRAMYEFTVGMARMILAQGSHRTRPRAA